MAKSEQRLEAVQLRRDGNSIKNIAKKLNISRSSASVWCRDIILSSSQKQRLLEHAIKNGQRGRLMGAEANKNKRLENISTQEKIAGSMVGNLTTRDRFMLGIALYWGEGTKSMRSNTSITNSDPETILFARHWFEQLGVERNMFRPYIFISETHKHREKAILRFWSEYLDIPKTQFAKMVFLKGRPKKIYDNHDSYYGVLALRIRKGSTLKYRILALIKACKEKAGVAQVVRA